MSAIFTLTSDFGLTDAYIAILKGNILCKKPTANIVDISHFIPPRDVMAGGWVLKQAYKAFPEKSIHIAAVGSRNELTTEYLAISYDNHFFLCPNNGLFSLLSEGEAHFEAVILTNNNNAYSLNFSANNLLVPAAISLSNGIAISSLGEQTKNLISYKWAEPFEDKNGIQGLINHIDHYGNLITNIAVPHFDQIVGRKSFKIYIGNTIIRQQNEGFLLLEDQEPFVMKGPSGMIEISIKGGNASELLSVLKGAPVSIVLG